MADANKGLAQAMPKPRVTRAATPPGIVEFYRTHYRALLMTAMYTGANKPEAEDAVSETMKELLRRWPELTDPLAYARRAVVSNFFKDRTRGLGPMRRRVVERGAGSPAAAEDLGLMAAEGIEWVRHLLSSLPAGEREVMALIVDGYTPTEIAEMLQKSAPAVRHRLFDARKRLKQVLQQDDGERRSGRIAPSRKEADR